MIDRSFLIPVGLAFVFAGNTGVAKGQNCIPQYTNDFPNLHLSPISGVSAFALFDFDGAGPSREALVIGGNLGLVDGEPISTIAVWDGQSVEHIGESFEASAAAFCTYVDAANPGAPTLVVGGDGRGVVDSGRVAQWNGAGWTQLGGDFNDAVRGLAFFDEDGTGPNPPGLFACGPFTSVAGVTAMHVARWDGQQWSAVGAGLGSAQVTSVNALAVFDPDGAGPGRAVLVAGGNFLPTESSTARYLAKWDGSTWSDVGNPITTPGEVFGLRVFDHDADGPATPELYACGNWYSSPTFKTIARWDGETWRGVGTLNAYARGFAEFDLNPDDDIPAGLFIYTGTGVYRWNGSRLATLDGEPRPFARNAAIGWDSDGPGGVPPSLFVSDPDRGIIRWGCGFDAPDTCIGDISGDRRVGLTDLSRLLNSFGSRSGATRATGDLDYDGDVDLQDLSILLGNFGINCGPL
ncbi:MAG: hypothetical protein IT450_12760 [Phycisphaerales bacterium]|nr:hypothetical protein [Phycisphaerales bacterium]